MTNRALLALAGLGFAGALLPALASAQGGQADIIIGPPTYAVEIMDPATSKFVVGIKPNGEVAFGEGVQMSEGAMAFWKAVGGLGGCPQEGGSR